MNEQTAGTGFALIPPFRNFSMRLPTTPRGAHLARRAAVGQLRLWDVPLDPACAIVAELAANAATHGRVTGRDFRMTLFVVRETLRIELTDTQGHLLPKLDTAAEDAESGRGLMLVDALATRWGVSSAPYPKKTVWAEVVVGAVGGHPASAQSRV